jgi:hypothetical protein
MDGSALHGRRRSRDASGRQPMSYRWQATDLEGLEPEGLVLREHAIQCGAVSQGTD